MKPVLTSIALGMTAACLIHAASAAPAEQNASFPVLVRAVRPGDEITLSDIVMREIPKAGRGEIVATEEKDLVGHAIRRPLPPGRPVALADIVEPMAIRRGENILLTVRTPGMTLTAMARALEDGRKGDIIHLQNLTTRRTIDGRVVRAGEAEAITGIGVASRLADAR